jgi:hypothetical protein
MPELNQYTYIWDMNNDAFVFDFQIPTGKAPENMQLYVYFKSNPGNKLFRESVNREIIFNNEFINGQQLNGKIWLNNSGADHGYVEAYLDYGKTPSDKQFEGAMVKYFYNNYAPVIPAIPCYPSPQRDGVTTAISPQFSTLFPYINITGWPFLTATEENLHFINYPGPTIPATNSLFGLLAQQTTRDGMEEVAVIWIESASFISSSEQLSGPISNFYWLDTIIERKAKYDPLEIMNWIAFELKVRDEEIITYINSAAYIADRDNVWQSWFAMVMLNGGYRTEVFDMLRRTIVFCHFVETIANAYKPTPDTIGLKSTRDETIAETITPVVLQPALPNLRTIECLLDASILLQSPPFPITIPLPPYSHQVKPISKNWVEPYAVGHLEMVRKKRIGYQCGDLAHIENVMRGERRETKKRKLSRIEDVDTRKESTENIQENNNSEIKNNFEYQVQKAAAESFTQFTYDKLTSTYGGPSMFTLGGSYEIVSGNSTPEQLASSGFGEYVITKTIQRLRRNVEETRQRIQTDETEESTGSIFDNTEGKENLRGVYRWLNEVYEARVLHYGSRLLIEFSIDNPAEKFIAECKRLYGIDLEHPKTFSDFGINTYNDISFTTATVFLTAALQYFGVYEWPPEPVSTKMVSLALTAGNQLNVPIPEGYAASSAVITLPLNSSSAGSIVIPSMNGIIGQSAFDNTNIISGGSSVSDTPSLQVSMHGETGSIAVILFDILSPQQAVITNLPAIPPAPSSSEIKSNQVTDVPVGPVIQPVVQNAISVSVNCLPTSQTIISWQLKMFQLLIEGSKKKEENYYDKINTKQKNGGQWLPPDLTVLEKRVLRSECIDQLFVVFETLTGVPPKTKTDAQPGMFTIYEPVINDFFNKAFEWKELSWSLSVNDKTIQNQEVFSNPEQLPPNNLSAFLQAHQSRVLVPVTPAMSLAVLYFLSTGVIWQGRPEQVPVVAQNIQAALAIKVEKIEARQQHESAPWTFEVPTSLLVLDVDNGLCINKS